MHVDQSLPVIADRTPAVVMAELAWSGAVLVRADGTSHEDFVALGDALMSPMPRAWPGGEREPVAGDPTTTTVTHGTFGMPLHREASYAPHAPSLLMFRCEQPASDGGETVVCDGVALLRELPEPLQRFVTGREVFWEWLLPDRDWQAAWGTDPVEATRAVRDWGSGLPPWESLSAAFTAGGMTVSFRTSCTPPALFDGVPAFCNSLLMLTGRADDDYFVETELRARLAGGSPFPDEVLAEVAAVAERVATWVAWRPGDILLINNTRVMHGRRPFRGERRVLVRMGHILPEWMDIGRAS